ncbi:MAG: restriction endonuclease subunit S [Nitrospira sp.]|nr:restriction endonuclease subunit S [Nitrospira sp.]
MSKWPLVPLGEILTKSEDWVALDPEKQYNEVTVRLWGKGVVLRRQVIGAEIASSRRLRVRANQFILSRIDARNGAIGLVPESLDGAVVSTDFPTFALNAERVIPPYLGWMGRTPAFVDICKQASEGTTNRIRLQEDRFLHEEVPLPPLAEQRRIVARIESLAAMIEEVSTIRQQAIKETSSLGISGSSALLNVSMEKFSRRPLSEVVTIRVEVLRRSQIHFIGTVQFRGSHRKT